MKNKIVFSFLAIIGIIVCAVAGLVIGATYGGNYAVDFVALGTRGYEATGKIGIYVGALIGLILSIVAYQKKFRKNNIVS